MHAYIHYFLRLTSYPDARYVSLHGLLLSKLRVSLNVVGSPSFKKASFSLSLMSFVLLFIELGMCGLYHRYSE